MTDRVRTGRWIAEPKGRGREPIKVPLTEGQSDLAAEHYKTALGYAARFARARAGRTRHEDVSDLAWAGLYAAVRTFDPARSPSFTGYLWRCVRLHRGKILRTTWMERRIEASILDAAGTRRSHEAAIEDRDEAERILARLPAGEADALKLLFLEGMTAAEAGGRMKCDRSTIFALLRRARRWLRGGPTCSP